MRKEKYILHVIYAEKVFGVKGIWKGIWLQIIFKENFCSISQNYIFVGCRDWHVVPIIMTPYFRRLQCLKFSKAKINTKLLIQHILIKCSANFETKNTCKCFNNHQQKLYVYPEIDEPLLSKDEKTMFWYHKC